MGKALKVVFVVGAIGFLYALAASAPDSGPPPTARATAPVNDSARAEQAARQRVLDSIASLPELELRSWNWGQTAGGSYAEVNGEIKNLTDRPIRRIRVIATFRAKNEDLITTDEALIEFEPLMPGQSSPFKVMARWNPMMHYASLAFESGGERLRYKERGKKN